MSSELTTTESLASTHGSSMDEFDITNSEMSEAMEALINEAENSHSKLIEQIEEVDKPKAALCPIISLSVIRFDRSFDRKMVIE